ncbi:hypothetical protein KA082_00690 [Candidatus Woesebacteria bacterium]|nr:hypothetical protein [Candidatus Woesebacteria bacterium]
MAVEVSISIPLVSIGLLFVLMKDSSLIKQSILLFWGMLILSSLTHSSWSLLSLIGAAAWMVSFVLAQGKPLSLQRVFILSLSVTVCSTYLLGILITSKVLLYALSSLLLWYFLYRVFGRRRSRQRLVEWLAMGG